MKGMKESDSQNIQDEEESSSFISNTLLLTDVEIKFRLVKPRSWPRNANFFL